MRAALPKIARIERYSYNIEWNKLGAIFYGGLARQVELTKERKADPPDPRWPAFEYGNPGSFRKGLSTLPNAISAGLGQPVGEPASPDARVKLAWKLTSLTKASAGPGYVATFATPQGEQVVHAKSVTSTAPAHALSHVLQPVLPDACAAVFDKVREAIARVGVYYPPVAAVTVAYPKSAFKDVDLPNGFGPLNELPGFGSLNPRTEGVRTLGTLWSSSLFPGRAPDGYHLLLNYIGGSRDTGIAELSEDELIAAVDEGCRQVLLKDDAPPPKVIGLKVWPTAIPQYELGHLGLLDDLYAAEAATPGLWVMGNYRTGVAFPDCVTFGYEHAKAVQAYLEQQADAPTDAAAATSADAPAPPAPPPEAVAA